MDSKELIGKVAKGILSIALWILFLKGLNFSFASNWLLSIVVVVGGIAFLYFSGLRLIISYMWKKKLVTIATVFLTFLFLIVPPTAGIFAIIENYLATAFILFLLLCFAEKVITKILFPALMHEMFDGGTSGSYTGASYGTSSRWDEREAEQARRDQYRREENQRAKDRYDALDRQKKAEYDARTAASWGKDRAAQNFKNDADYWRNQRKKY